MRFTGLLRYVGGKSRAIKSIREYMPDKFSVFIEPMCGGASVFFFVSSNMRNMVNRFVINDIDKNLTAFYICVRDYPDQLIDMIKYKLSILSVGDSSNMSKLNLNTDDDLDRAATYYVRNRISFSGMTYKNAYSSDAHRSILKSNYSDKIRYASNLLQGVEIYNTDYTEVLKDIHDYDNTFVFFDPPYYSNKKNKLYGPDGIIHTGFDHERLRDFLSQKRNDFKFLITYDKDNYLIELYKDFYIDTYSLQYCMKQGKDNKCKMVDEIFIYNYTVVKENTIV